jgi:hypothetical protein
MPAPKPSLQIIDRIDPKLKKPVKVIILPNGEGEIKLTQKQFDSIVAWKQGIMYIAKWHPFGKHDIYHSREPIEGVKYEKGIGSANRSLIAKGTKENIPNQDMGIVSIHFNTGSGKSKPYMDFESVAAMKAKRAERLQRAKRRAHNDSFMGWAEGLSGMR